MATVTRENIGVLNDKIIVKVNKEDYFPSFEKSLKNYSKSATIPGFRKGMVPAGIIKKMHGQSVFTDEVLRSVEKELTKFMDDEKLDIFAQPLPLAENDARSLDVNNPAEYTFGFEVGLKPDFRIVDLTQEKINQYKIEVTDEMINQQIERLQKGYGKKKVAEAGASDENKDAVASEGDKNEDRGKVEEKAAEAVAGDENKVGEVGGDENKDAEAGDENIELAELNEELFKAAYPGKDIKTEDELRAEIKKEIEAYWETQSKNHLQHEIYHRLLEHSEISFPENFLKRWLENSTEKQKSPEEVEKEFPSFVNQLKWSLITDRIGHEQNVEIKMEDIRDFAKKQLFGYMGMQTIGDDQPWVEDYLNKMMQDNKFMDDSYHRLKTEKIFEWAESQVQKEEKSISVEDFGKELHQHEHVH